MSPDHKILSSPSETGFSEKSRANSTIDGPSGFSLSQPSEHGYFRDVTQGVSAAYATADDVRFYKPISNYEGLHRWDPYFEWENKEEKRLVRKVRHRWDKTGSKEIGRRLSPGFLMLTKYFPSWICEFVPSSA